MLKLSTFEEYVNNMTLENIVLPEHIFRHMFKSDYQLMQRAAKNKKISFGASTFDISQEKLILVIKKTLLEYAVDLTDWINDPTDGDNMVAILEFDETLGHGYYNKKWHNWNIGSCKCHRLACCLKKIERKHDTFFKILTVFCEPTDEDIAECTRLSEEYYSITSAGNSYRSKSHFLIDKAQ